ncbi:hypothetical protein ABT340_20200 [Streptosporangium sp. NPDC000239]|uniref:hypothetical protein n=1 Tax=Streptosporangium sp. NPDC000239 TaxID=3154248 RepID=UPI003331BDAC
MGRHPGKENATEPQGRFHGPAGGDRAQGVEPVGSVYDPRMAAPRLRASDASGRVLDDPTDTEVHDLFADLNARWMFAIVERLDREPAGQFYFQVHLDYAGGQNPDADEEVDVDYDVEFREGGPDEHYRARITGLYGFAGLDLVHRAYRAWRTEDPGLRDLLSWRSLKFESRADTAQGS